MSANPSQRAPHPQGVPRSPSDATARIRRMIEDLDMPLDAVPRQPGGALEKRFADARRAKEKQAKTRYRSDLQRARDAAVRVFKIRPSLSSRKATTAMLTAGAVGLAAFTGPFDGANRIDDAQVSFSHQDPTQNRIAVRHIGASADFKRALIEEEGVRFVVYRDVAGYPTVGVGHLVDPADNLRVGDRISREQVLRFLETDLAEAEGHVRDLVGDLPLFQHEFDALVDLVYNVGPGNVAEDESPRLNAAIGARDYDGIAAELDYTHAAGRVARGLEFRSERRAKIFLDAAYDDPRGDGFSSTV